MEIIWFLCISLCLCVPGFDAVTWRSMLPSPFTVSLSLLKLFDIFSPTMKEWLHYSHCFSNEYHVFSFVQNEVCSHHGFYQPQQLSTHSSIFTTEISTNIEADFLKLLPISSPNSSGAYHGYHSSILSMYTYCKVKNYTKFWKSSYRFATWKVFFGKR